MKKLHRALHLQHHAHTGRLLHHRHTSYRGLGLVLVLATACVIGLNVLARVTADSYIVTARVPAPIPTTAAVITDPTDGTVFHTTSHAISGNCPVVTPRVIIAILDNGVNVGSSACDVSNVFTVPITLNDGAHTLVARSYTITNDAGPDSDPVHVTVILPPPPPVSGTQTPPPDTTSTSQPGATQSSQPSPLSIAPDQAFLVYGPQQDASWSGSFSGGTPPYTVAIDWGDGNKNTYTVTDSDTHVFTHHYGSYETYDITVQITDSTGNTVEEHFAAVTPYVPPVTSSTNPSSGSNGFWSSITQALGGSQLVGLYTAYASVLVLFGVFWLRRHRHPFAYAKVPVRHRKPVKASPSYAAVKRRKAKNTHR